MTAASTIDDRIQLPTRDTGRRTNPLRSVPILPVPPASPLKRGQRRAGRRANGGNAPSDEAKPAARPAARRQRDQLPAFAPLLEELEVAGWTARRPALAGSFHDWVLLGSDRVMVAVGHAVGPAPLDPTEAALVVQSAWAAVRAHALHAPDAGALLTLASQTLWPAPAGAVRASVAVALVDTAGGQASVALAGDCLAWRVRAATTEQLTVCQPLLGGATDFAYLSHSVELSLRERLVLAADDACQRAPKLAASIAAGFSSLDAESHRRMTAAEAVALVREHYEQAAIAGGGAKCGASASLAAVRRR